MATDSQKGLATDQNSSDITASPLDFYVYLATTPVSRFEVPLTAARRLEFTNHPD